jgi:hypothetical protein
MDNTYPLVPYYLLGGYLKGNHKMTFCYLPSLAFADRA